MLGQEGEMCGCSHVSIYLLSCDVDQHTEKLNVGPCDCSVSDEFLGILWFLSGNDKILLEITTKVTSLGPVLETTAIGLCADYNTALLIC